MGFGAEFWTVALPSTLEARGRHDLRVATPCGACRLSRHERGLRSLFWKKEAAIVVGAALLTVGAYRVVRARRQTETSGPRRCPDCRGEGRVKCFQCQGKTFFQVEGERVPHACLRCGASGRITCGRCSGTGYITPSHSSGDQLKTSGEGSVPGSSGSQAGDDSWRLPDQFRQNILFLWFDWYRQRRASAFAET